MKGFGIYLLVRSCRILQIEEEIKSTVWKRGEVMILDKVSWIMIGWQNMEMGPLRVEYLHTVLCPTFFIRL